jgi:hypothetical protein
MFRALTNSGRLFVLILALAGLLLSHVSSAEETVKDMLPPAVSQQVPAPLAPVGSGTYRKLGFNIYRATLWAPGGVYNPSKPYALALHYNRSVSKDTLVDTVMDDIRDQNVADDATLAKWQEVLNKALSEVAENDVIVGVAVPGKKSTLFYNGKEVTSIEDAKFSTAFFNIWLGDHADENLRNKLLANAEQP